MIKKEYTKLRQIYAWTGFLVIWTAIVGTVYLMAFESDLIINACVRLLS